MIANTINIRNGRELVRAHNNYSVPYGETIKELIEQILGCEYEGKIDIVLHEKYLPKTYQKNPAQFALRIDPYSETYELDHLHISAYRNGEFIVIHRGDTKISNTFFRRAVESIRDYDMMHALKGSIPLTYLMRPKQFTRRLINHFGCGFATIAKRRSITWSRREVDLDKYGFIC